MLLEQEQPKKKSASKNGTMHHYNDDFHTVQDNKKTPDRKSCRVSVLALPIFPGRRQPSIVSRDELNYRVRNGNGWTLALISTNFMSSGMTGEQSVLYCLSRALSSTFLYLNFSFHQSLLSW